MKLARTRAGQGVNAPACPAWCKRDRDHDVHIRHMGEAAGVVVQIAHMDSQSPLTKRPYWDSPRIIIRHSASDQVSDVLLPVGEAFPLAAIFRAVGQDSLATLIEAASALAQNEGRP